MFHARKSVTAPCSVATPALNPAPKTVPRAKSAAATPAGTASARKNAASLASHAMRNAPGNASIRDAPNCAGSHAIVPGAMNRVQSFFLASIPVSVCAANDARRSAESATRTRSRRFSSEPKTNRTRGSWNWPTVVTCLKLR